MSKQVKHLCQDIGKQMLLQVEGHTISQMAIINSEQPKLMSFHLYKLSNMIIFHGMISFPFYEAETILDQTLLTSSSTRATRGSSSSKL